MIREANVSDAQTLMRRILLDLNEQVKPIHEWLDGQRSHFRGQGYTEAESRAMSAATFVTVFGSSITRTTATE
jgi:hypothetical protein